MQNSKERKSNIKIKGQEELELDEILRELEEDERLQNVTVPEHVTSNIYAQIAAYQTAVDGIESEEVTTAIVEELNELEEQIAIVESEEDNQQTIVPGNKAPEEVVEESKIVPFEEQVTQEEIQQETQKVAKKKKISRRSKKIYVLIAAVFILTMAMGMVGVGTDYKWLQLDGKEIADYVAVEVDSEDDMMKITAENEIEAKAYVKEILGVTPIMISDLQNGMQFESVEVNGELGFTMQYSYNEKIIYYTMVQNRNITSHAEIQTGNLLDEYVIECTSVEITVQEYLEVDGSSSFKATFTHNNIFYGVKATMGKEEFEEILKNLYFF